MRAVVGAVLARRRSARRRSGRRRARAAYARSAVHSRSKRTWSASAPRRRAPSRAPSTRSRARKASDLALRDGAPRARRAAAPAGERRRRRVRRAELVGRPERQHLPPATGRRRRASRRSGTPPRRAGRPAARSGAAGCRSIVEAPPSLLWPFTVPASLKVTNSCSRAPRSSPPSASRSRTSSRRSTADATRSSARGRRVEVSATIFKDGHDVLARGRPVPPRGHAQWLRGAARAGRERPLGRVASRSPRSAAGSSRSRRGSTASRRCATSSTARSTPGRRTSRASSPRPRRSSGPATLDEWHDAALAARRDGPARQGVARPAARGRRRPRARALRRLVRALPALVGRLRRAWRRSLPQLAELGFDVVYLPPIHPIGTTNRKGRNNALVRGEGRSRAARGRSARREGGHDALHPELGTIADFDRLVARAREHGLEIALDFAIQCSPDHPWLKEHPEWFNRRPDGTLKYAENPPKRYQDIYNVNFDSRGLARAVGGAARRRPPLVPARRARVPRRQPAHEAGAVLGVADRRGARGVPRGDLPRRGVHAAGDDDRRSPRSASASRTRTSRGRTRRPS